MEEVCAKIAPRRVDGESNCVFCSDLRLCFKWIAMCSKVVSHLHCFVLFLQVWYCSVQS